MISYEATLVCDKCRGMMPGATCSSGYQARNSALQIGHARGWITTQTPNGIGTGILCPECKPNEATPPAVRNVSVPPNY